jgi:hypothetical protein
LSNFLREWLRPTGDPELFHDCHEISSVAAQEEKRGGQVHVFGRQFSAMESFGAEKWTSPRTLQFSSIAAAEEGCAAQNAGRPRRRGGGVDIAVPRFGPYGKVL